MTNILWGGEWNIVVNATKIKQYRSQKKQILNTSSFRYEKRMKKVDGYALIFFMNIGIDIYICSKNWGSLFIIFIIPITAIFSKF